MRREPEVPEERVPVVECLDGPARITFGEKCSYAHRQVDEQPSKRSKKNGDRSAVAMLKKYTTIVLCISGYGAAEVFIDFAEELKHTETDPMCKIHGCRCTSRRHSRPKSFARNDLPR